MVDEDRGKLERRKHALTSAFVYVRVSINQAHLHAAKAFDPSFPPHRASPLPTFKDILIQREREETGWVGGERSAEKNTLSSFTGAAPGGEARRRPNSNFGRRLIFADNGQRIFPRRPFLLPVLLPSLSSTLSKSS